MKDTASRVVTATYLLVALGCVAMLAFFEPVTVSGGSMRPALQPGDVALVKRHAPVRVGDIALIRAPGHSAVVHRVIARRSGRLTTMGDANPIRDFEACSTGDVAGRVVGVLPVGQLAAWWRGGR